MLTDNPASPLILIVEDDQDHAELMKAAFQRSKEEFRLEIAVTLHAARNALKRQIPDLILTDFRLPDGDGSELVVVVNRRCPIILLTSQGNEQVAVNAMKAGVQDYVIKSVGVFSGIVRIAQQGMREWALLLDKHRSQELIVKNEAKQRAMIKNIVDVIAIMDQDGKISYKSPNVERLFGWQLTEVVGEVLLHRIHPDDQSRVENVFKILTNDPSAEQTEVCRYRCKDGSYKWIEFTASNLGQDPEISGFLLSYHDITSRKLAEDALIESMNSMIKFHSLSVNRELKIIELKKEVNELLKKRGKAQKYRIVEC